MKNEMNKLAGLRHAGLTMIGKTFLVFAGAITLSFGLAHGITPEPSSSSRSGAAAQEEIKKIELEREISDLQVRVYGDAAVVTGRALQKGVENSKDYSGENRFTRVYMKQNGHWVSVALQVTLVAK